MTGISKFWLRFGVVFFIHIMIKSFDRSFPGGPFELNLRSLLFSIFFIGYGMLVWQFAGILNRWLHKKFKDLDRNSKRLVFFIFIQLVFAFGISLTVNHLYRLGDVCGFGNRELWDNISWYNPELIISLICIYLILLGFDGYFRIYQKLQQGILKAEKLKKENILARYQALKAQIEPHFLFNSLSVLSSLVYENADTAADFIVKLSKTLRYIIEKNERVLVKLSEELEFLNACYFLIKTRLENGVFLENNLAREFIESTYIPPVTLQILVENAVACNKYNPDNPLKIKIEKVENSIVIRNNLNLRNVSRKSTGTGLKNISTRYELISGQKIGVVQTLNEFSVYLPVLTKDDYERFNI